MPAYLQIEHISKAYGPKILFEDIGFTVNEGDKIALIAPNGTGKTSLLRILAGKDKSDSGGRITFLKDIRIAFLEQDYAYDRELGVFDQVLRSDRQFLDGMEPEQVFQYGLRVRKLLTDFGIDRPDLPMKCLSGGEVKRVAVVALLATEADFFLMDEPTNHLDIDAIEQLESCLSRSRRTLLMVTHDRYFLDRVCNTVMEMDRGAIYAYKGDYTHYLEKRAERIGQYNAETDRVRNLLRRELEWMRSTPCARSGKAKYRKSAFYELKDRAEQVRIDRQVDLSGLEGASRLGSKIIDCKEFGFSYGGRTLLKDFTCNFGRYERIGIVGRNGTGKSTFLNLLTGISGGEEKPETSGSVERGESLKIGYYRQGGLTFDEDLTVIEVVPDTRLLNQFLFGPDLWHNRIAKLSGGERRRLYLLSILAQRPNLLVLDEPTNDLDIVTLNILEEYLLSYRGSLLIVSHDRHFLDRTVEHLLIFRGDGTVKDFVGTYSEYREYLRRYEAARKEEARKEAAVRKPEGRAAGRDKVLLGHLGAEAGRKAEQGQAAVRKKLTYKERRELEQLERDLAALQTEKSELTELLGSNPPFPVLQTAGERLAALLKETEEKELRWLELAEYA